MILTASCASAADCSPYADCAPDFGGRAFCRCQPGFDGDGRTCLGPPPSGGRPRPSPTRPPIEAPPPQPVCLFGSCSCDAGFRYDGSRCVVDDDGDDDAGLLDSDSCRRDGDCGANAGCKYDGGDGGGFYRCQCNEFYVGEQGVDCRPGPGEV